MSRRQRGETILGRERVLALHERLAPTRPVSPPWSVRRVELAQAIARGNVLSPTTRRAKLRFYWWRPYTATEARRMIREGYAVRALKPPRKRSSTGRRRYLALTDKGRALLTVQPIAHTPAPYAKRKAALAEFEEANA